MAYNVIGLAKVWNFMTVRPADEHIKETKFPRNDQTSQQTKSVARSAGGIEIVRPKTEVQQGFEAEITSVRHTCAKPLVSSGPSIEHSPTNAPKQSLNCYKTVPGYVQLLRNNNSCYHTVKTKRND